jgi:hypothetical protein
MARRPKPAGLESSADLARKMEILEREMASQREALERLKQMGPRQDPRHTNGRSVKQSS